MNCKRTQEAISPMSVVRESGVDLGYQLPPIGFLKLRQIIGDPKAQPPIPALLPISRTSFLNKVKDGTYPKPVRLGKRSIAWRVHDINKLIERIGLNYGR